ncbi:MAG: hypothetical protein KJ051_14075 [Thermoleophilia bacterium]|nr:hypothetical protein [Thermoleophilia bacterium]
MTRRDPVPDPVPTPSPGAPEATPSPVPFPEGDGVVEHPVPDPVPTPRRRHLSLTARSYLDWLGHARPDDEGTT